MKDKVPIGKTSNAKEKKISRWIENQVSYVIENTGDKENAKNLTKSLVLLEKGVKAWNNYRKRNPSFIPYLKNIELSARNKNIPGNLEGINFAGANLEDTDLSDIFLHRANFTEAKLKSAMFQGTYLEHACLDDADLRWANFNEASLSYATLSGADLTGAIFDEAEMWGTLVIDADLTRASFDLTDANGLVAMGANFTEARLIGTNLRHADLGNADLSHSLCIGTDFREANLSGARVFGASVWDVKLDGAIQSGLNISKEHEYNDNETPILVDDLEVAQFIHLLLNHKKLHKAINAVTQRGVLLLGQFKNGGYEFLNQIATTLRTLNYLPIIFDFERPTDRNYTETIKTLVGMVRFVMADIRGPSVPQELYATVPHFKIPFVLLSQQDHEPYSMIKDILEYDWVIKPLVKYERKRYAAALKDC